MSFTESSSGQSVGTITFLMTDVEGSTQLWERFPDAMSHSMLRHHTVVHEEIRNWGGHLPPDQGEGDSVVGAFGDVDHALSCAVRVQQTLANESWPASIEIRVRIALHTGEGWVHEGGNYFGTAITQAPPREGSSLGFLRMTA